MITFLKRLVILAMFSQWFLTTPLALSATIEETIEALNEARNLHAAAIREGASWTIAIQHLEKAEILISTGEYENSYKHANRAIYFFKLGLIQKQLPLYEHQ
ncbi:MAG: hypothetical protein O3A65_05015 [Proteobacteria bacterium]|nr:hypothetical protein [Pseudomonadota bacterium]